MGISDQVGRVGGQADVGRGERVGGDVSGRGGGDIEDHWDDLLPGVSRCRDDLKVDPDGTGHLVVSGCEWRPRP